MPLTEYTPEAQLNIRVPHDLRRRIKKKNAELNYSFQYIVQEFLREYDLRSELLQNDDTEFTVSISFSVPSIERSING